MAIEELTEEEVKFVLEHSDFSPEVCYGGTPITNWLLERDSEILSQHLKDARLIELGPGHRPQVIGNPSEYVGVEPLCPDRTRDELLHSGRDVLKLLQAERAKIVHSDAYSFLRQQPDDSAVIISFGVFTGSVIGTNAFLSEEKPRGEANDIVDKYFKALSSHIWRITRPGSITYHRADGSDIGNFLREVGFIPHRQADESGYDSSQGIFYKPK